MGQLRSPTVSARVSIRPLRLDDIERVTAIEVAAGQAFVDVGLPEVADDEPFTATTISSYADDGRAWVVADEQDAALAYILVDIVDDAVHIEQVSVHPDAARSGLGRALIDHVAVWAAGRAGSALTLTTFRDVPWNAPYYERLGFSVLEEAEIGVGLRAVRDHETAEGLDPSLRVCMRRDLTGA